jgi:hypothetical protein
MYQTLRRTAARVLKSPRDQILLAGMLAYLLSLEAVGRQVPSGALVDLFLFTALLVGGVFLAHTHMRQPVAWIAWGTRRFRRVVRNLRLHTFRIGWDLRRQPAVPRRTPPLLLVLVGGCELLTLGALIWILWQPIPARELIGGVSSVGFAAAQFVLWCSLLLVIVVILLAGPALLRDLYVFRQVASRRRRRRPIHRGWFFALFITLCVAGMSMRPVSVAVLILAGSFLVGGASIWLPPRREFDLIWQPRGRAVVYSMSWRTCVSLLNSVSILVCLLLLFLSVGRDAVGLPGREAGSASVSHTLGTLASWVAATGAIVVLWPMTILELMTKRRDPSVPAPTRVRVRGPLTRDERKRIRHALQQRGWSVGFGASKRSATEVSVQISREPESTTADSGWPRTVSPDEFADEKFLWSIARRDQIQRRRVFLRRLESILKQARRRRYEQSSGFWIAPQYWFVLGLTRDTGDHGREEEQTSLLDVIPPLYHQAFPLPVRQHFHEICRALEIDLMFLEDGVQWRGLRRVLRMMFEHYDVHGGTRRIEELHFTGLPRVRVIIHEFELGAAWERGQYPEPDFEDLARARVLHVFRDRGEEEVPRETPRDWDRLPSPVPAGSTSP